MRKRSLKELAVCELGDQTDLIEFERIRELFVNKTSDIVYITIDKKVYGIVCLGDILHHMKDSQVSIVKSFLYINDFQEDKAREIFAKKSNIQKIPVIKSGILQGDYSRWDDAEPAWIQWIEAQKNVWSRLNQYLKEQYYNRIYVIEPTVQKEKIKEIIINVLSEKNEICLIQKEQVMELFLQESEHTLFVMSDEDERRGMMCIQAAGFADMGIKADIVTFSKLYREIDKFDKQEKLKHYGIVIEGEGAKECFASLQKKGVKVLALYNDIYYMSNYIKKTVRKHLGYIKEFQLKTGEFWPIESSIGKEFFAELLDDENYTKGVAQQEIIQGHIMQSKGVSDYSSVYYNVENGRRKTCFQSENCQGKVYMFGNCIIMGAYLEDQYTIESQLQKKINTDEINYRVENCGMYASVFEVLQQMVFREGDVVIIWTGENTYAGIESVELRSIFEKNNIPAEWCLGSFAHINHKITEMIAHTLYGKIKTYLQREGNSLSGGDAEVRFEVQNYGDILGNYIKVMYLERYFTDEELQANIIRGCLVVEGDAISDFYLEPLQKICSEVDELIIFIPGSLVSVQYRFVENVIKISELIRDNKKIKIIPGDEYVPYFNFIPTYYLDYTGKDISVSQSALDAKFFAQCIAKPLNIAYRFRVMGRCSLKIDQYNKVLKEELPQYGVKFIEV